MTGYQQFAVSRDEASGCCRTCCAQCHPYTMQVTEQATLDTSELVHPELLTIHVPCPSLICCMMEASFTSGGQALGSAKEIPCSSCVPSFRVYDSSGEPLYLLRPPTCCCGQCMNCCSQADGNACCKPSFQVSPTGQPHAGGPRIFGDAIGKIYQEPKSGVSAVYGPLDPLDVQVIFPNSSTPEQKAMLVGTGIFLNYLFFGGTDFLQYQSM